MYVSWSIGGATRLLQTQDISVTGDMNKCDKIKILFGDRGFDPEVLTIIPE